MSESNSRVPWEQFKLLKLHARPHYRRISEQILIGSGAIQLYYRHTDTKCPAWAEPNTKIKCQKCSAHSAAAARCNTVLWTENDWNLYESHWKWLTEDGNTPYIVVWKEFSIQICFLVIKHTAYPNNLHSNLSILWYIHIRKDTFSQIELFLNQEKLTNIENL